MAIRWYKDGSLDIERNADMAPTDNGGLMRFLGSLNYVTWALTEWVSGQATQRVIHEAALREWLLKMPQGSGPVH